jgi:Predicted metal-dependent hydrolase
MMDLRGRRAIDLTHEMYHGMPSWPTNSRFSVEDSKLMEVDGYRLRELRMNTHHGDPRGRPSHMLEDGAPVDAIPLERLMGEGVVLDLTGKGDGEPITAEDLRAFDGSCGGATWSSCTPGGTPSGGSTGGTCSFGPTSRWTAPGTWWGRGVSLVGTEGLSIGGWGERVASMGPITDTGAEVHRILLSNGVLIVEEVANLGEVLRGRRSARAFFIVMPLRLRGLDGSPARVVAIAED